MYCNKISFKKKNIKNVSYIKYQKYKKLFAKRKYIIQYNIFFLYNINFKFIIGIIIMSKIISLEDI